MDAIGTLWLKGACKSARIWAERYSTLYEAWQNCPHSEWMEWALRKLHREGLFSYAENNNPSVYLSMAPEEIRRRVPNPFFVQVPDHCCLWHGTQLSPAEVADSMLVGTLPRCRECLDKVGLPPRLGIAA